MTYSATTCAIALELDHRVEQSEELNYGENCWSYFISKNIESLCSSIEAVGPSSDVVPSWDNILESIVRCKLTDVKVVILGQDPYYQRDRAVGMSFSQKRGDKISVSLRNIYTELRDNYPGKSTPNHGDLTSWADQGVLLLNASLTTLAGKPDQHSKKWSVFVDLLISYLNELMGTQICYLVWGANAKKLLMRFQNVKQFISPHPASRNGGFSGCQHFIKADKFLRNIGRKPVNWFSICD